MAQLQSSCVLGTLSISASHANAQDSIIIGGASNTFEFTQQCDIIAIGENTALSGSGALNANSLTVTQEGCFNFPTYYQQYVLGDPYPSPEVCVTGGGGSGATFTAPFNRGTCQPISVTLNNPGSGYTSTVSGCVCDNDQTGEVCELFTIDPFSNENVINIGHNAGCRAQGSNTIRIGACAGVGNTSAGIHYQDSSIAIGKNTMHSGSFFQSVVIGNDSLTGANVCTNTISQLWYNTVVGTNNLTNPTYRACKNTVMGYCNFPDTISTFDCNTVLGTCNGLNAICGRSNVVIGDRNACISDSCKLFGSTNVLIGGLNMMRRAYGGYNVAIGLYNMCGGLLSSANWNLAVGYSNLRDLTTGDFNIGIGCGAGRAVTTATRTISIGHAAGLRHVTGNESMYLGAFAGAGIFCGDANVIVGAYAAACYLINNNACRNQIFGYAAAQRIGVDSLYNTFIGHGTACNLRCCTTNNIYIGSFAGLSTAGTIDGNSSNIVIGYYAGNNVCGDGNIFIGCGISNCSAHTSLSEKFHLGYGSGNCLLVGCLNSGGRTLGICGTLSKTAGSFQISHPDPAKTQTKDLWHSFVESPTAGDNLYRFEVEVENGQATIDLPDYYKHLNENDQLWVNAKNHFGRAYGVVNQEQTTLTVFADTDGEYNVLLIGTRKDEAAVKAWKGTERLKEN